VPEDRSVAEAPWKTAGISVCGARHLVNNTPCQDAVQHYVDEHMAIVAVADGHGDPKYSFSEIGAQIAVDVACELLMELSDEVTQVDRPSRQLEEMLKIHLPQRIAWEWNRRVLRHAGHTDDSGAWHEDVSRYGTTLLGAIITEKRGLFFQLGDGDILLIDGEDGARHTARVFPLHDDIYGSVTHSLCQPNSARYARIRVMNLTHPRMMVLSSDGVSDSLQGEPDPYLDVGPWLLSRVAEAGFEDAVSHLPPWLSELSLRGNGDDATMGLIYWRRQP
jgi:serine/threonine protein phosphatase PrpC